MELTQQLACTQDLYQNNSDKSTPEQIGFLGICGNKYPVKKGPNKIGRDPDTCNIVLNLNSISRHHAVINVLNKNEFMLMDLDSANKTKLNGKTLQPYLPSALKNGDMVQVGHIFGVFRLLEEENDLPLTQAIDVPETPVKNKCKSTIYNQCTTIPESPDISDRDESFIGGSQQKTNDTFRHPKDIYLKISAKTISIEPLGTNKIDNVYWRSSKNSESFISQCNISNNHRDTSGVPENIHELETQLPFINKDDSNQPNRPLAIHEMETQVPEELPEVTKVDEQQNIHLNFFTDNTENEDIFNAETQLVKLAAKETDNCDVNSTSVNKEQSKEDLNVSDDIIIFDEIDSPPPDDNLESQLLVIPEDIKNVGDLHSVERDLDEIKDAKDKNPTSNTKSECATVNPTDCEDDIFIAMTQKIQIETNDDDVTDCEDELESTKIVNNQIPGDDLTDCEDELETVKPNNSVNFEDMCVQVLEEVSINKQDDNIPKDHLKKLIAINDMPTQVIEDKTDGISDLPTQASDVNRQTNDCFEEALTQQIYSQEIINFKRPSASPLLKKTKASLDMVKKLSNMIQNDISKMENEDNDIYYMATQQLFDDLCSQRKPGDNIKSTAKTVTIKKLSSKSPSEKKHLKRDSQESEVGIGLEENVKKSLSNLSDSSKVFRNEKNVRKRNSIEKPELKSCEKKENINKDEQKNDTLVKKSKIKKGLHRNSSSLTKREDINSGDISVYLNKKSETEVLPSRSSSRIRKPTARLKNSNEDLQKLCNGIFGIITMDDDTGVRTVKDKDETISKEDKLKRSRRTKDKNEILKQKTEIYIDEKKDSDSKTRNSRSRTKKSNENNKRSVSSSEITKIERKDTQSKDRVTESKSPEKEIRRSKRHRTSKKSGEPVINNKSETISNRRDQSTVYNVSSESGIDSPNKLKRSANFEYPTAKKSKFTPLRSNPARKVKTHYVLFTAFPCDEVKIKLEELGATIVTDVSKCTVLLTMQIKRTFKLLCAVGLGKPVVGPSWVQACADTNTIVDPWKYLIKDEVTEKRFQFSLERSLTSKRNFLRGYNISSTANVIPNTEEMKLIVQCSGGNWKEGGPLWICVSCTSDESLWPTLKKKGAIIVSTEFILAGVLRQKLEIDKNRLM